MKFKMSPNSLFAVLLRSPWWVSFALMGLFSLAAVALLPRDYALAGVLGTFPFFAVGCIAAWRQWHDQVKIPAGLPKPIAEQLSISAMVLRVHQDKTFAGAMVASLGVFSLLKGAWLALFFAAFVSFSATQMFLDKKSAPTRQLPGTPGLIGTGGVIGFLSGLVGAGGGFVSVPFMTWCNVPIHNAIATSAALGLPIALANVVGYALSGQTVADLPPYSLGYIWLPALGVIAACSVFTAPLGAKAAHVLPVKQLKRVFATILFGLAAYMLHKGLTSP